MLSIPAGSLEYVQVAVTANVNNAAYNPTSDQVEFAFPATSDTPTTWYSGAWETTPAPATGAWTAQCLIGPGGTATLTAGTYAVWLRITDNPERPVRQVGLLQIT